jgi:hypothetical protein
MDLGTQKKNEHIDQLMTHSLPPAQSTFIVRCSRRTR